MAVNRSYGTLEIPGDQVTVSGGGTVSVPLGPNNVVGLVGGMDTSTGSATPGSVEEVATVADARDKFGQNSELYEQVSLATQNGAPTILAVGVEETETTDQFSASSSGTLSEIPFNPDVQYEHTIEVASGEDVVITYEDGFSAPTAQNTVKINPVTKNWKADTSGSYDITYTHGDYTTAISAMAEKTPGFLTVLHEATSLINEGATLANEKDDNFGFMEVVGNTVPGVTPSSYNHSYDDFRVTVASTARGYLDDAQTKLARTAGAYAGKLASKELGVSSTYDNLQGFTGLEDEYTPKQAGDLVDAGVTPIIQFGGHKVVKDMTTSTDSRFERVYAVRVADEVAQASHIINQDFTGEQKTDENLRLLERSHRRVLDTMVSGSPQMLNNYTFEYVPKADDNTVGIEMGVDVVNVIDNIDVSLVVGDVVTNETGN